MENNNRQGCRWVKASEKMPVEEGRYAAKRLSEIIVVFAKMQKNGKMVFINSLNSIWKGYKDFEWLDESIPCATSSDAIQFAEWLMENNYKWEIDGLVGYCWYEENESGESKLYAAADLYKIYKSQTPSPTGDRDCEELKKEVERLKGLIDAVKLALKEIYTGTDFPLSIAQNALQLLNL